MRIHAISTLVAGRYMKTKCPGCSVQESSCAPPCRRQPLPIKKRHAVDIAETALSRENRASHEMTSDYAAQDAPCRTSLTSQTVGGR